MTIVDEDLSLTFAALADPTRRAILSRLAGGEATVNQLAEPFAMTQQAISKHLKILERAGLISRTRAAQRRPCQLETEHLDAAAEWIGRHRRLWEERYDRLDEHLATLRRPPGQAGPEPEPARGPANKTTEGPRQQERPDMSDTADRGELTYRRVHDAPRELLFDCMTNPEHLTHFWGPDGTTTPVDGVTVDLRPGGVFETVMVSDADGSQYTMRAVYVEVQRPGKLVWTEPDVEGGMTTTISFVELGDGRTEVVTHQTNVPAMFRSPEAQAGFLTSLDRFGVYVALLARRR